MWSGFVVMAVLSGTTLHVWVSVLTNLKTWKNGTAAKEHPSEVH